MDIPSPRAEWESEERSQNEDDEASGESPLAELPAPAQRRPIPPPLTEVQTVLAEALSMVLLDIKRARRKFATFSDERVSGSASILVRYGLDSIEAFRTTDEQARRFLFEDLRKSEQLNFPQLGFLLKLPRHVPPHDQKLSGNNIRFAELDIPRDLASYAPLLTNLSGHLLPDQEMVNFAQKECALAEDKDPPFVPYLNPKLSDQPWMPADADHCSDRSRWLTFSKQAKRTPLPQDLSTQAFSPYRLRFALAADLCKAWHVFGGLGPQLSHLSTVLHISVTESVGAALSYRRLVAQKLQEKARKRPAQTSEFVALLSAENFTLKEQAKKEVALAIDSDQRARDAKPKGKGKQPRNPPFEASDQASSQRSRSPRNSQPSQNVTLRRNDQQSSRPQNEQQGFRQQADQKQNFRRQNHQAYGPPRNAKGGGKHQARR